jgi:hypothetical protein
LAEQLLAAQILVDTDVTLPAIPLLQHLLSLDDSNFDVYFFLSVAYSAVSKPFHALYYAHKAKALLTKELEDDSSDGTDPLEMYRQQLERFPLWESLVAQPAPLEEDVEEEEDVEGAYEPSDGDGRDADTAEAAEAAHLLASAAIATHDDDDDADRSDEDSDDP